ncbi:MAG TPA: fluoride efflux transporter CrcB [Halieaceae bacterium]|nr:fluoride efflux transporter CrcB [Halieaceae bacterium]
MIYLAVALGGALGALSRFGIGQWLADSGYAHLHPATFLVNVIGALLVGVLFIGAERFTLSESARLGMSVGFLGAFTTFSAFSLQLLTDIQEGQVLRAVFYASATVFLCLISCLVGMELARSVFD